MGELQGSQRDAMGRPCGFELMILLFAMAVEAIAGCGTSCPFPVDAAHTQSVAEIMERGESYTVEIEARSSKTKQLVHSARGILVWGEKTHIGGTQHRELAIDIPDYEVNADLLAPDEIWTSIGVSGPFYRAGSWVTTLTIGETTEVSIERPPDF